VSQIEFLSNTQWTISFYLSLEGEGKGGGEISGGKLAKFDPLYGMYRLAKIIK